MWLLIRVALQLTLDFVGGQRRLRSYYKEFMIFLLTYILDQADQEHVSHDILFFMKAKIDQRVLKLGAMDGEGWYRVPREITQRIAARLADDWAAAQSRDRETLALSSLSTLDFGKDTLLGLRNLRPHLAHISRREKTEALKDDGHHRIHSLPFRRAQTSEPPSMVFSHDKATRFFELADFERWVESDGGRHVSLGRESPSTQVRQEEEEGYIEESTSTVRHWTRPFMVDINVRRLSGFSASSNSNRSRGTGRGNVRTADNDPMRDGAAAENRAPAGNSGKWLRLVDNTLAREYRSGVKIPSIFPVENRREMPSLCDDNCKNLDVLAFGWKRFVSPERLGMSSRYCDLCEMLYQALWPPQSPFSMRSVKLYREGTNLWANGYDRPLLRICSGPERIEEDQSLQVGPPQLLDRSSPAYFELLLRWLQDCDRNHGGFGCRKKTKTTFLPNRVIDVGEGDDGILRLMQTKDSNVTCYVALSHCWGEQSDEDKKVNCALKSNLKALYLDLRFDRLGQTFKDAITVTRRLGQRYLWIDSLCIVQDDEDDWTREAACMEDVFSSAYCVIAATAAKDTRAGFLKPWPEQTSRFVAVPTPSGALLYFCDSVDDFSTDVEGATLSRRGWVLQERALARRTIHFSTRQTYWECGRGIRSESLALLKKWVVFRVFYIAFLAPFLPLSFK